MDTFASGMIDDDCLKTETQYEDDQDMSVKQDATAENPDKMIDDLQNPMSQAPPSVRSEYDAPESPAHYSPPPSPMGGMDSPPMSPMLPPSTPGSVGRPPRPDTANSMMSEGGTPTPIAFGTIPRSETPMSQRKSTNTSFLTDFQVHKHHNLCPMRHQHQSHTIRSHPHPK